MGPQVFTAHHEAGHAVVAIHLGWTVNELHLENFQDGWTDADPPGDVGWREHVLVLLGGAAGEALVGTDLSEVCNVDDEYADALERCTTNVGPERAAQLCAELQGDAVRIVEQRRTLVEALAAEAIRCRTLTGDRIAELVAACA